MTGEINDDDMLTSSPIHREEDMANEVSTSVLLTNESPDEEMIPVEEQESVQDFDMEDNTILPHLEEEMETEVENVVEAFDNQNQAYQESLFEKEGNTTEEKEEPNFENEEAEFEAIDVGSPLSAQTSPNDNQRQTSGQSDRPPSNLDNFNDEQVDSRTVEHDDVEAVEEDELDSETEVGNAQDYQSVPEEIDDQAPQADKAIAAKTGNRPGPTPTSINDVKIEYEQKLETIDAESPEVIRNQQIGDPEEVEEETQINIGRSSEVGDQHTKILVDQGNISGRFEVINQINELQVLASTDCASHTESGLAMKRPEPQKEPLSHVEIPEVEEGRIRPTRDSHSSILKAPTVLLYFQETVYALFSPNSVNQADETAPILILDTKEDHKLYFLQLENFFAALHRQFPSFEEQQLEMVLVIQDDLSLELPQDNMYCREISLYDLHRLHRACGREIFRITLQERPRFIYRFNSLVEYTSLPAVDLTTGGLPDLDDAEEQWSQSDTLDRNTPEVSNEQEDVDEDVENIFVHSPTRVLDVPSSTLDESQPESTPKPLEADSSDLVSQTLETEPNLLETVRIEEASKEDTKQSPPSDRVITENVPQNSAEGLEAVVSPHSVPLLSAVSTPETANKNSNLQNIFDVHGTKDPVGASEPNAESQTPTDRKPKKRQHDFNETLPSSIQLDSDSKRIRAV